MSQYCKSCYDLSDKNLKLKLSVKSLRKKVKECEKDYMYLRDKLDAIQAEFNKTQSNDDICHAVVELAQY